MNGWTDLRWEWVAGLVATLAGWWGKRQSRPGSWLRRRLAVERTSAIQAQTILDLEARLDRRAVEVARQAEEVARLTVALDRLAYAANLVRTAVEGDAPALAEISVRASKSASRGRSTSPTGSKPSRGGSPTTDSPSSATAARSVPDD